MCVCVRLCVCIYMYIYISFFFAFFHRCDTLYAFKMRKRNHIQCDVSHFHKTGILSIVEY